ncbi:prenyltransferase [Penicillium capsulatum]|uniref:Prenyltransferase n=1 Tax=Penicillium capsulatum TaxID=69766 RepID=A0A9W9LM79_9EURO|nr:prenyltransferase [Penicillium capsulatum]KAJ6108767.1 prenyltransferase [Penicillium capsulatum]
MSTKKEPTNARAYQYGGNYKPSALDILPASSIPYIQLARLSPPAGLFLIYFPHLFGVLHAAIRAKTPPLEVLRASTLLLEGSFFFSNAAHTWNDLIDASLDAQVERTRHRPIPRGAVSKQAAFIFTMTQGLLAICFLVGFPTSFTESFLYTLPSVLVTVYYPWAKRHTYIPQVVLGFALAWGIVVGEFALGVRAILFTQNSVSSFTVDVDWPILYLFVAGLLWPVIYDTLYAQQDLQADLKVGIKSLAVLFHGQTKGLLWPLLIAMVASLILCGWASGFGMIYYVLSVGGVVGSLGAMIFMVNLTDTQSCWWWFSKGFWLVGGAISGGLLGEYYVGQQATRIN